MTGEPLFKAVPPSGVKGQSPRKGARKTTDFRDFGKKSVDFGAGTWYNSNIIHQIRHKGYIMSKKDKLKKQAAAQLEQRRRDELEEQQEKERAKGRQSMAAKKMRRAARRGYIGAFIVFLTILMLLSYIYSGLVYGLVITVYGSLSGQAELIPHSVAYAMLIGDILMAAGIVLSFRGK